MNNTGKWMQHYRKRRAKKDKAIKRTAQVGIVVYILAIILIFLTIKQ